MLPDREIPTEIVNRLTQGGDVSGSRLKPKTIQHFQQSLMQNRRASQFHTLRSKCACEVLAQRALRAEQLHPGPADNRRVSDGQKIARCVTRVHTENNRP